MRLERMREIAKQSSLVELAQAERTLAQIELLSVRVNRLAGAYTERKDARDGYTLGQQNRFSNAIGLVSRETAANASGARAIADRKQLDLEECEKRRSSVEDVRTRAVHALEKVKETPQMAKARRSWHGS